MRQFFYKTAFVFISFILLLQSSYAQEIPAKQAFDILTKNANSLTLSPQDIQNVIITSAYTDKTSGMQLFYLQQTYLGLPVYNSIQIIALKDEKVVSNTGGRVRELEGQVNVNKMTPGITAKDAVLLAAKSVNVLVNSIEESNFSVLRSTNSNQKVEFNASNISRENITADLIWVPQLDGTVKLAWQVKILPTSNNDYWFVRVSAQDGTILGKDNLTVSCNWNGPPSENIDEHVHQPFHALSPTNNVTSFLPNSNLENIPPSSTTAKYRVIPYPAENIFVKPLTVLSNPWLNAGSSNAAITLGWHNDGTTDYSITRGNNVWAKDNLSGSSSSFGTSASSTTAAPDLNFNFIQDPLSDISTGDNLKLGITNLFYWNNIIHDIVYQYGFDEVSGNFQNNNLGRGGFGNDFVVAEAQNGAGTNNADFSTPSDGNSPRMRMFLWSSNPLIINSPSSISGIRNSAEGQVSTSNLLKNVGPVTGDVIVYAASTTTCGLPANATAMSGKIALVYTNQTGGCSRYDAIIKNAQSAGAIGVMVAASSNSVFTMGGSDNSITIPAIVLTKSDADAMKTELNRLGGVVNVTLKANFKDGDLDNGIVTHEFAHGISNRLTGGPASSSCLVNKEQMGEGWSDYYALMLTTDWGNANVTDGPNLRTIGNYVADGGIRKYPYTTDTYYNPLTYADLAGVLNSESHDVGEIWATALWDMTWALIQMEGINPNLYNAPGAGGNSISLKLVTLGMKLQPCTPGFLDGRDAILKADEILYNGKYRCVIWNAFANRGMGANAIQGSSDNTSDQTADFTLPTGAKISTGVDKTQSMQEDFITYSFKVRTQCSTISNYKIIDTLPTNVTWVSGGTYNGVNRTVTFSIPTLGASQDQTFTLVVKVNNGAYYVPNELLNEPINNYTVPPTLTISPSTGITWSANTLNHSPSYSLKTNSTTSISEQILTSSSSYTLTAPGMLSFWHAYNTESTYDGGVVELSNDGGTTWVDAAPYIFENGYNSTIANDGATALMNRPAYSGNSNGFIRTTINLFDFVNKPLKFRFRFASDNGTASAGWNIDDILLSKTPIVFNKAYLFDGSNVLQNSGGAFTQIIAGSVPITWSSFTVEKSGKMALLKWTTSQESNTAKFFVERSEDGIHFTSIGNVNAAGNSSTLTNYSFTDEAPLNGINYFRILQTDKDGRSSYTDIRSLVFDNLNGLVSVSPNPAKDKIVLTIKGNKENTSVVLLNTAGQPVATFIAKDEKNYLTLPALASGVYYLKIMTTNGVSIEKLVIQ
ncbi:MAG: M36 family metallopeptidase [Ginsengibacter sp.]|jgi:hypothetical protein